MVSDVVTVKSRAINSNEAYKWESRDLEGYEIEITKKETVENKEIFNFMNEVLKYKS